MFIRYVNSQKTKIFSWGIGSKLLADGIHEAVVAATVAAPIAATDAATVVLIDCCNAIFSAEITEDMNIHV